MRLLSPSPAWGWGLVLASVARAQSLDPELSFGHGSRIAPEQSQTIPHFTLLGSPHAPEVLSNKVVLTPGAPAPGNQRGAVWAERPLEHAQWTLDVDFRVSGPERGGGNLNVWLAEDGPRAVGAESAYSVGRFKGLVLVLDTTAGASGGGSSNGALRAYLNDGTTDFKAQPIVDSRAFAHCAYGYRNLGRPSQLRIRQSADAFRVDLDGQPCLESDAIVLPAGYHVGVTAASADVPDAAEIFKVVVHRDGGAAQAQPRRPQQLPPKVPAADDDNAAAAAAAAAAATIPDADADAITSSRAQFADLHNRLQSMQHQLATLLRQASGAAQAGETRHAEAAALASEVRGAAAAQLDRALDRVLERLERLERLEQLQRADAERLARVERAVQALQTELPTALAGAEANLVRRLSGHLQGHHDRLADVLRPAGHGRLIVVIVGGQLLLVVAFAVYKRRRSSSAKKYL